MVAKYRLDPVSSPGCHGVVRVAPATERCYWLAAKLNEDAVAKSPAKTSKSCFFITPIGAPDTVERRRADWIFHHVIEPVAEKLELDAERADLMSGSAMISTNIFKAISEAPVCVADLTGLNPNVFYEIGVRHSLKLPIIHLAQAGTTLPFDTAPHLTHFYDLADFNSMAALKVFLSREMKLVTEPSYAVSNPFTHALGNIEISRSGDPKDQVIMMMDERIRAIENRQVPPRRAENATSFLALKAIINKYANASKDSKISLSLPFVFEAIDSLTPSQEDEAQELLVSLLGVERKIQNSGAIIEYLYDKFPNITPY